MVLEPALLLADEPTGNLDRATGEAIHQLFLELNREHGSTLLVVTHNPELANLMPRRLRMVDGGRLVDEHDGDAYRTPRRARRPARPRSSKQRSNPIDAAKDDAVVKRDRRRSDRRARAARGRSRHTPARRHRRPGTDARRHR